MLTPHEKALDIYVHSVKYVSEICPQASPEDLKREAKFYAKNIIGRAQAALYECTTIDDFVPHKTLEYYRKVNAKIDEL